MPGEELCGGSVPRFGCTSLGAACVHRGIQRKPRARGPLPRGASAPVWEMRPGRRSHDSRKETISPVKELQGASKEPREDRTDRSLPLSKNLEGFLGEAVPRADLKADWDLGEECCRRDGYVEGQHS